MIDPTPSLLPTRPAGPPFAVEAGSAPDGLAIFAVGTAPVLPAAGSSFARALDGLIAAAGSKLAAPPGVTGTPAVRSEKVPVSRQILAGPGSVLPDGATSATVVPAPIAAVVVPELPLGDGEPAPAAAKSVKDEDEWPEPRLEPALAWLLPPPPPAPPTAALPVAVIVAVPVPPPVKTAAPSDGPLALARPTLVAPVTGDEPVALALPVVGKMPVARPDGGGDKVPIQRLLVPEPAPRDAPPVDKVPIQRLLVPEPAPRDAPPIDKIPVSQPSDGVGKLPIQRLLPPAVGVQLGDAGRVPAPVAGGAAIAALPTPRPAALVEAPADAGPRPATTSGNRITAIPAAIPTGHAPSAPAPAIAPPGSSVAAPVAAAPDGRRIDVATPRVEAIATAAPDRAVTPATALAAAPAAIAATVSAGAPAARRADDPLMVSQFTLAAGAPQQPVAITATGDAQQAGVDLTRDHGLHRMIDRIETLRDAADARDTRIRLIPDALGPVDVTVRRDGEAVHVHFTATEAATRQLIADAQPRLADLAEARGVRIDRATVDGGATGQHGAHQSGQQTDRNARPNRAPLAGEIASDVHSDPNSNQRIA